MRVLMISKALVVAQYRSKAQGLALKPGIDLTVVCPPAWKDERGIIPLEKEQARDYKLVVCPIRFNGHFHIHYYRGIAQIITMARPDLIHIDEEPYNFATYHALSACRRLAPRARSLFFTWQNLNHNYPPPFSWMESFVYENSDLALAGNRSGEAVLRSKGFRKPICVLPQFGVDPAAFRPLPRTAPDEVFRIGFAARLVPEKGASVLLRSLKNLEGNWELNIVGSGPERAKLASIAKGASISDRVHFLPWRASSEMPSFYNRLDAFVAPSLSKPTWTEQFGRVLVEAMACGIPVIGSDSGEIPNVIGDAGLIFREGDTAGLTAALRSLMQNPPRREELGTLGRKRVLSNFTQSHIVDKTYQAYCDLLRVANGTLSP